MYREKRLSYSNDRTLNPSISLHEEESPVYGRRIQYTPRYNRKGASESSCGNEHGETVISKAFTKKASVVTRSPGYPQKKASGPPKRAELTKKLEPVSKLSLPSRNMVQYILRSWKQQTILFHLIFMHAWI